MVEKVLDLDKDFKSIKELFGKGKKKTAKQLYEERLKEQEKEKEEQFYRMKLETMDKIELKKDKFAKVKRKLRDLIK